MIRRVRENGLPRAAFAAALASALLAGCGGSTPVYQILQNSISTTLASKQHRAVRSVACTPRVGDVSYSDGIVNVTCVVAFKDGSSYSTPATIEARSFQVTGWNFTWQGPPSKDITQTELPAPVAPITPTSSQSLFYEHNLKRALNALAHRFRHGQLILSMSLYPAQLEAVIGANGSARRVVALSSGTLTVGPSTAFYGSRSGITISQVNPAVPQELARLMAARGGLPMARVDRFVLAFLPGSLAGWDIYPTSGPARFQSRLQGDALKRIAPGATRSLN
jgi:hypothetical protein